jgi:hypothetical protein
LTARGRSRERPGGTRVRRGVLASASAALYLIDALATAAPRSIPDAPAQLTSRLEDVEALIEGTPESCRQRLDDAQSHLDSVNANPAVQVMFAHGWARTADDAYRIHHARASCLTDPAGRTRELTAASLAARQAVQQYRDVFDYRSMVIEQFNIAASERALGMDAAASAALQIAIDMDLEYGFHDDARENCKLLLGWKGEPQDEEHLAALIPADAVRAVTLRFDGSAGESTVVLERERMSLANDQVVHSHATSTLRRHISADHSWRRISYEPLQAPYELGVWPSDDAAMTTVFPPALLRFPEIELSSDGVLRAIEDVSAFATHLSADTQSLIRAQAPQGKNAGRLTQEALQFIAVVFAPDVIEATTSQNYNLETAMWIDATLEQGIWYRIAAPLSLPGLPHVIESHEIEFAYTHSVPCTSDTRETRCVELVLRTSEPTLSSQGGRESPLEYVASRYVRIVTDPSTLRPYVRDTRSSWYLETGQGHARESLLESERTLEQSSYP